MKLMRVEINFDGFVLVTFMCVGLFCGGDRNQAHFGRILDQHFPLHNLSSLFCSQYKYGPTQEKAFNLFKFKIRSHTKSQYA